MCSHGQLVRDRAVVAVHAEPRTAGLDAQRLVGGETGERRAEPVGDGLDVRPRDDEVEHGGAPSPIGGHAADEAAGPGPALVPAVGRRQSRARPGPRAPSGPRAKHRPVVGDQRRLDAEQEAHLLQEVDQRRPGAGLDVGPGGAAEVGEHEVVLDVARSATGPAPRCRCRRPSRSRCWLVRLCSQVSRSAPGTATTSRSLRSTRPGALGEQPLLAQRVAVVGGDRRRPRRRPRPGARPGVRRSCVLRSGSFAARAARPGERHVTHVDGETQIGRQTFRRAVEQVRRGRGDLAAGLADDVQVRVLGGVVDRRALAQVGVPDQAEPLEQLEVAVDGRGVGRGAARAGLLAQPRADRLGGGVVQGRRPPPAPAAAGRSAADRAPAAARRAARRLTRYPCDEPRPAVGQAGRRERSAQRWPSGGTAAAVPCPADEPVVTAFDQGLGRGDGVFESVAVVGGGTPHLAAAPGTAGPLGGAARARRPRAGGLAGPARRRPAPTGRPTSRASAGCSSPAVSARGCARPRWPCSPPVPGRGRAPARRGHLGGQPRSGRARRTSAPGALAARWGQDALLRGQHGRPAARARAHGADDVVFTSLRGPAARGADVDRRLGRRTARCTRRRWRPGSCRAPPRRGCSTGRRTTAGRPPSPAARSPTCTPPTRSGCSPASGGAAAVHTPGRRRPRRRGPHGARPGAARPVT